MKITDIIRAKAEPKNGKILKISMFVKMPPF